MTNIYSWSKTAADNSSADSGINFAEGQAPSTVNNSARALMGRVAEFRDDISGTLTAGGTANGLTVTANSAFTSYANGRMLSFIAAADNTGAATLSVNGVGAKAIRRMTSSGDAALEAGTIQAGGVYLVQYNTAANSGAGAWLIVNPVIDGLFAGTGANTFTGAQTIGGAQYGGYDSTNTDIVSAVAATSNQGAIIGAPSQTNLVVGIRENTGDDCFAVISGGGDYNTNSTYDTLVAKFKADGSTLLGGTTFSGDTLVSKSNAVVGVGISGTTNGGLANYAAAGSGDIGVFSNHTGGSIRLRPDGRISSTGEFRVTVSSISYGGNIIYYAGGTDVPISDGGTGASTASAARSNLGLGTAATQNTGTSGATVPLLSTSNTWSDTQSAPIWLANSGTASAPAFSFTGDSDTGMFRKTTNTIGWTTAGTEAMSINSAGNLTVVGDVTASSDARLKEDVRTIETALETVHRLRGVRFRRKGSGVEAIGFIAQEVEKVLPELVHEDEEGFKSVAYANTVAVLVEAVKELAAKVEMREARK